MIVHKSILYKPLIVLLNASLIVGLLSLLGLAIYLFIAPMLYPYQEVNLPVLLQVSLSVTARSISSYILYAMVLVSTITFALLFLFFLRQAAATLIKGQGFSNSLSKSLGAMGWFALLFSYTKQIHLFLYVQQVTNEMHQILHFTFTPITEEVVFALSLFVLAKVFEYALQLQSEVEMTI